MGMGAGAGIGERLQVERLELPDPVGIFYWQVEEESRKGQGMDRAGLTGLAWSARGSGPVLSIHHNPCYHKLNDMSSDIIVLVFSELAQWFERFCKVKKTKG
jgi:hypothetical protein